MAYLFSSFKAYWSDPRKLTKTTSGSDKSSLLSRIAWISNSNTSGVSSWLTPPEGANGLPPDEVLQAFARLPVNAAIEHLDSSETGLSTDEVEKRIAIKGSNTMKSQKPPSRIILLLKVIPNPFNLLLMVLAIINASIPPPDWKGFTVLMVMVVISCSVRFWQEYRSSVAVFRLQSSVTTNVRVRRQGEITVEGRTLVPGDVILLSPGDVVPADCLVIESSFLRITQSQWTGESDPVSKSQIPNGEKELLSVFDLDNIVLMGTGVVSGHSVALVLRTGDDVLIAAMSKELAQSRGPNAFQKGIRYVTWMLLAFMSVMVPIVLVVSAKTTGSWGDAALFSVSVAVGLVPEMLPAIVNANLARGAYLLSKKRAIVRRLDSVQNLGAMTVLCSDKTGTLTKDEISLHDSLDCFGIKNTEVLKLATIEATLQGAAGNAMDEAIKTYKLPDGSSVQTTKYERFTTIPFDFERRRSSCIVYGVAGGAMLICKGAFEEVFARCSAIQISDKIAPIDHAYKKRIKDRVRQINNAGYRVLLVATKSLPSAFFDDEDAIEETESNMIAHGLLAFIDPPRPDAATSIAQLKRLGVEVKVLTGDNLAVALNVCRSLDLVSAHESVEDGMQALTGYQLSLIAETPEFDRVVKDCKVFAKVTPSQKKAVITSLRKTGNCVGMLGDGMNDCLALKEADVGISVDSAAGAAKDCADFILTEKGLGIIADSVNVGRYTHANTIKYIKMVLSSNFGNVFSILTASAWLPFTPMLNLQILAQNLLYDVSQIAIPWDNVDKEYLETPKSWQPWDLLRFVVVLGPTSSVIDICTFCLGWFFYNIKTTDDPNAVLMFQTHWFLQGLLTQTLIVHMLRTSKIPFLQSRSSLPLGLSTALIMTIGFVLPWIPTFQKALSFVSPAPSFVGFLAAELLVYCLEVQVVKMIYIKIFKTWL